MRTFVGFLYNRDLPFTLIFVFIKADRSLQ